MNDRRRPEPQIIVANDSDEAASRAADLFVQRAEQRTSPNDMFTVAFSGGHTPEALFRRLASDAVRAQVPWDRTQVFFSDERFVPPESPESNFRMADDALLSHVPVPARFIHRVPTVDVTPAESASNYEEGIRRILGVGPGEIPRFDLILLGLGSDGHTASLFPDTKALHASTELVVANFVPQIGSWRITFTYPLINAARCVMFLVQGEDKAPVVKGVLSRDHLPAAGVRPADGELIWVLDSAAAADIPPSA